MTSESYPGPWCAECGYPATERTRSIDPRHPLGKCNRSELGCNQGHLVALVLTRPEANVAYDNRRRRLTTARHGQHDPKNAPQTYCDRCPRTVRTTAPVNPGTSTGATQAPGVATGRRA